MLYDLHSKQRLPADGLLGDTHQCSDQPDVSLTSLFYNGTVAYVSILLICQQNIIYPIHVTFDVQMYCYHLPWNRLAIIIIIFIR